MIAKEATFLISIAAEEFLKRFTQAAHRVAERDKRLTVQTHDMGTRCRPNLTCTRG